MLADAPQRQRAVDPSGSFIVQAPAGSGKTELLTQRYLALLGRVEQPEHIVAITFTRKAAAEMRGRIVQALLMAHDPEPEEPHKKVTWDLAQQALVRNEQYQWHLLEYPSRLRIQTIDSFGHGLVRQMPMTANLPTQPSPADDASALYRAASRRTLQWLEGEVPWSDAVARLLGHFGNNHGRVEALLANLLACRDAWMRHLPDATPQAQTQFRHELEYWLTVTAQDQLRSLEQALPYDWRDTMLPVVEFQMANLGGSPPVEAALADGFPADITHLDAWRWLYQNFFTGSDDPRKSWNVQQGFPSPTSEKDKDRQAWFKQQKQTISDWVDGWRLNDALVELWRGVGLLPPLQYPEAQWEVMRAVFDALPLALAELRIVFETQGAVDHNEIARAALMALGDEDSPSDLMLRLDYAIHHLLIDEFQDTSLNQFNLFRRLVSGWQAGDGRSFFAVGDPMQSIYRFRDADVGLFLKAWEGHLGDLTLTPLQLTANFRSCGAVVNWNNRAFQAAMPKAHDINAGAVAYSNAQSVLEDGSGSGVYVHAQLSKDEETEAECVTALTQQLLAEDDTSTVAILVRSRRHVRAVVQSLRRHSIGFQGHDIEALANRMVVSDLMCLTRALSQPCDQVAWLALLRAPWLGLPLTILTQLVADSPGKNLWQCILGHEWQGEPSLGDRFNQFKRVMSDALSQKGRWPLSEWVRRTWLQLDGPATLHQDSDLDDAERYFEVLGLSDEGGDLTSLTPLQERVDRLYALPSSETDGRVQVMTIHKSKGLEFDHVILPGLGRAPKRADTQLLGWIEQTHEQGEAVFMAIPQAEGEEKDPIYRYIQRLDAQRETHELTRVLYVAATRAIKQLHLLGHAPQNKSGQYVPAAGSFLAMLWPVVADEYRRQAEENSQPTQDQTVQQIDQHIRRLGPGYVRPERPRDVPGLSLSKHSEVEPTEFDWAGELARHVGSVVHRALQHMTESQILALPSDSWMVNALIKEGVPKDDWSVGLDRIRQALTNTMNDSLGRHLLGDHINGCCELALSGVHRGNVVNVVIDRVFEDEGERWIVDYKTSRHEGSDVDEFLASEKHRYEAQLTRYGDLMNQLKPMPTRLVLYFPMLCRHIEWSYQPQESVHVHEF